ncbi:hypothetical protein niasHT_002797 [Heterodera trifolii]|uniref:RING-type domain-containing protein n=1 Tax=Heterodera trifolii TaxID=157864 RepID=A0ABD2MAG6_9BILA
MNSGPTRQPPVAVQRANSFAGPINLNAPQQRSADKRANTSAGPINLNAAQQRSDNHANTSGQMRQTLPNRPQQTNVTQSGISNTNTLNTSLMANSSRVQQQRPAGQAENGQVRRNPNQQQPASTSNINELNSSQVRRNPNQQQPASTSNINELNSNAAELDRLLALQLHNKMKQQMRLRDEGFARRTQKQEDQAAELHSLEVARAMQEEEYERGIMNSSPEDDHHGNQNSSESLEIITTELNDDDCAICLSSLSDGNEKGPMKMAVPCNHFFHRDCINVWLNTSKNCPICRAPVNAVNDVGQSSQGGASRNDEQSIQFPDESTLPANELPHYYEQIALLQSATIPTKLLMEEENGQMKIVMIVDIDLDSDHQQYLTVIDSNQEIHTLYIGRNGQNCMTFRDNNRRLNISRIIAIMSDDN